jgi:phosphate transport system permease protein
VTDAWEFLRQVPLGDLWSIGWFPRRGLFDVKTLVVGTLIVSAIAMMVAVPLGLGAAIYLSEFAKERTRKVLKPIIEILAGIPSVVLGYFAIAFINPNLIVNFFDSANKAFNLAAAGCGGGGAHGADHRLGRRGRAARRAHVAA